LLMRTMARTYLTMMDNLSADYRTFLFKSYYGILNESTRVNDIHYSRI
jgi:hypothetical protein